MADISGVGGGPPPIGGPGGDKKVDTKKSGLDQQAKSAKSTTIGEIAAKIGDGMKSVALAASGGFERLMQGATSFKAGPGTASKQQEPEGAGEAEERTGSDQSVGKKHDSREVTGVARRGQKSNKRQRFQQWMRGRAMQAKSMLATLVGELPAFLKNNAASFGNRAIQSMVDNPQNFETKEHVEKVVSNIKQQLDNTKGLSAPASADIPKSKGDDPEKRAAMIGGELKRQQGDLESVVGGMSLGEEQKSAVLTKMGDRFSEAGKMLQSGGNPDDLSDQTVDSVMSDLSRSLDAADMNTIYESNNNEYDPAMRCDRRTSKQVNFFEQNADGKMDLAEARKSIADLEKGLADTLSKTVDEPAVARHRNDVRAIRERADRS